MLYMQAPGGKLVAVVDARHLTEGVGPQSVNHTGQLPSVTLSFT